MRTALSLVFACFIAANVHATVIDLGPAAGYNLFIKNNFSQPGADSQGKIAVGGNASIGSYDVAVNYEPGTHREGVQYWTDADTYDDVLVVGGDLTTGQWSWGNVKGNLVLGGSLTAGSSPHSVMGETKYGSSIDFDAAFDQLTRLSQALSGLSNTGSVDFLYNNWLQLNGASAEDLYVANITGSMLGSATNLNASSLTQNDTVVINVSGSDIIFDSLDYIARANFAALDLSPSHILYNFYEAQNITFNGGFYGNILAPSADFTFTSGDLSGQIIAKSFTGNWGAQANLWDGLFTPYTSENGDPVSEPANWSLVLIGIGGLLLLRRRHRNTQK